MRPFADIQQCNKKKTVLRIWRERKGKIGGTSGQIGGKQHRQKGEGRRRATVNRVLWMRWVEVKVEVKKVMFRISTYIKKMGQFSGRGLACEIVLIGNFHIHTGNAITIIQIF